MNIADAKKNTVYTFKLSSGEELIAKVSHLLMQEIVTMYFVNREYLLSYRF